MIKQSNGWKIRFAEPADASALLSVYRQYIETPITFELVLPTEEEFAERIRDVAAGYPWLVCVDDSGRTVGYAYAHRHMQRAAYQWNAELSIYLDGEMTSRGLGKHLYKSLIAILKYQGVRTVYGGVTSPNKKSEALHLGMGFTRLGTYHNAGYKAGKWHDVMWFEKEIAPYDINPAPIIPFSRISPERAELFLEDINMFLEK